jgi:L-asparaginase
MLKRVAAGAKGVVLTQGTDTVEETAFVLDLLWNDDAPIVISGARRGPSLPGSDGPANLLAAVQAAASDAARRLSAGSISRRDSLLCPAVRFGEGPGAFY